VALLWMKNLSKSGMATVALLWLLTSLCHAQAISPRALVEVVDFGEPVVSPDGRHVAFRVERPSIERNSYDTVWYVQPMDGKSPPRRVADGGVPLRDSAGNSLPSPATWSPDGAWIYYRARLEGRVDVWRAAADGSRSEPLTGDPADVRSFSLDADGTVLDYSVGATRGDVVAAEQAEYEHGVRIDESVPLGQGLVRSGLVDGRPATQRFSGLWFQRVPLLADAPDRWKAIDLATRQRRDVSSAEAPRSSADDAPDLAGRRVKPLKIVSDPGSGRIALLERADDRPSLLPAAKLSVLANAHARRGIECKADACDGKAILSVAWRPRSDDVLFTVDEPEQGHAQSIFRWNVADGSVRKVASSRGHIANGARYAPGFCGVSSAALACVSAEADRPPRLERIDLETGKRRVMFDPNADLAQAMARAPARLLRWTDSSGRQWTGWYYPVQSPHVGPVPLFVTYYTCQGFLRGGLGDEWPLATFAGLGIAALCVNQPAAYETDAVKRYDQGLAAVSSVIDLLASKGEIDRAKVGMGGLSFGSEVALWTATRSRLLAAISISSPVISPLYDLLGSLKGDAFAKELKTTWQLGSVEDTPDRWRIISPTFNLDAISAPILFQVPEQEYIHALDYAIPLMRRHRLDLYVFPNEPHVKFQPMHKLAVYERNVDWFRFWLQGVEDKDTAKVGQYSNWRRMRAGR